MHWELQDCSLFLLHGCFAYSIRVSTSVSETLSHFTWLISFNFNHITLYCIISHSTIIFSVFFFWLIATVFLVQVHFPVFSLSPPSLSGLWIHGSLCPLSWKPGQTMTPSYCTLWIDYIGFLVTLNYSLENCFWTLVLPCLSLKILRTKPNENQKKKEKNICKVNLSEELVLFHLLLSNAQTNGKPYPNTSVLDH